MEFSSEVGHVQCWSIDSMEFGAQDRMSLDAKINIGQVGKMKKKRKITHSISSDFESFVKFHEM